MPRDPRPTTLASRSLTVLLAVGLFWAPLPYASVTPLGRVTLQLAAALALALIALLPDERLRIRIVGGFLFGFLGVALWGLFQSLPLPTDLARALSPESVRLWEQADELIGLTRDGYALSLAPDLSRQTALWLAALAAVGLAAAVAGRDRRQRRWLGLALLAAALFEALYGARRWTATAGTIWGREVPGDPGRLRGTFVNADHLGFYLNLALASVLAWLWWSIRRARRAPSAEGRILLVAAPALAWVTLFAALAFTGSRGALAAAVTATFVQSVLMAFRHGRWRHLAFGIGVTAVGAGFVGAVGLQAGFGRWLATSPYEVTWNVRRVVYAAAWELWQRFPLTGTGLGTFREVFRMVQPREVPGSWRHAHNDWLELLLTTGLVGAVIAAIGLGLLLRRLYVVFYHGPRSEDRVAALAALGALTATGIHSALDFGLTMPANAFTLTIICAAAAGAHGKRRKKARSAPWNGLVAVESSSAD